MVSESSMKKPRFPGATRSSTARRREESERVTAHDQQRVFTQRVGDPRV